MDADEPNSVARCRAGESSAWDELFDRHYEPASRRALQSSPPTFPPSWQFRSRVTLDGRSQQLHAIEIPTHASTPNQAQSLR